MHIQVRWLSWFSPKSIVGICGKYLTLYKLYSMYFWAEQTLMPTLVAMLLGVTGWTRSSRLEIRGDGVGGTTLGRTVELYTWVKSLSHTRIIRTCHTQLKTNAGYLRYVRWGTIVGIFWCWVWVIAGFIWTIHWAHKIFKKNIFETYWNFHDHLQAGRVLNLGIFWMEGVSHLMPSSYE